MIRQPSGSPAALALDVSIDTFTIAGINAHVYGLSQLPQSDRIDNSIEVSALHLLNPRLCDHRYMAGIAKTVLADFYQKQAQGAMVGRGLICVAFDQRNHGEREVKNLANQDWRSSNPTHAADMFSIYHGTSLDLSQLITYLPTYLFPRRHSAHRLAAQHLVVGVSLGGHAAYLSLLHEPRIAAGVVVIGCPDYLALMAHRAARSGIAIAGGGTGVGAAREFPEDLVEVVRAVDPAAMGVREIVRRGLLEGKKVLTLSGGADRLVPVACAEGFLREVREARERGEWRGEWRDVVCEGVGHECTPEMVRELSKAVNRWLEEAGEGKGEGVQSVL